MTKLCEEDPSIVTVLEMSNLEKAEMDLQNCRFEIKKLKLKFESSKSQATEEIEALLDEKENYKKQLASARSEVK
jgi:hypothetical protein